MFFDFSPVEFPFFKYERLVYLYFQTRFTLIAGVVRAPSLLVRYDLCYAQPFELQDTPACFS